MHASCVAARRDVFGLLALLALAGGLPGCSSTEVEQIPPETIGQRVDASGILVEKIVRETTVIVTTVPFTPEGPHRSGIRHSKDFLEQAGQPRRELTTLNPDELVYCDTFLPVENSRLWVGAKLDQNPIDPVYSADHKVVAYTAEFNIVVFDDQKIQAHRKLIAIPMDSLDEPFQFKSGNRTILFQSPQGLQQYNVLTDTVAAANANPGAAH